MLEWADEDNNDNSDSNDFADVYVFFKYYF